MHRGNFRTEQAAKIEFLKHDGSNTGAFTLELIWNGQVTLLQWLRRADQWPPRHRTFSSYCWSFFPVLSLAKPTQLDGVLDCKEAKVLDEMNWVFVYCVPSHGKEVLQALKIMHPNKGWRLDGFNPLVFQQYWDVVDSDVTKAIWALIYALQENKSQIIF